MTSSPAGYRSAVPGDTPDQQPGAGLRADAERNRCRILAAARSLYARAGLGVSMASIAREAGVGQATLSRRFPTKDDLIAAVFAERMDAYAAAVTAALDDPDPWGGFTGYLHAICAMQAADRGFADVLTMAFPTAKTLEARRAEAYDRLLELITRAKDTGHLRDDFTHQDVVILLIANAGVVTATGDAAPDSWRRLVAHMIRSYAAPGAPIPLLPEALPPTVQETGAGTLPFTTGGGSVDPVPMFGNVNAAAAALRNWVINLDKELAAPK